MARYQHTMAEGDPAAVPVREAATVMVLADAPDLEVLMVRRTARTAFGAGAWVFPGGRIDGDDGSAERAAVRETEEEAGLVLDQAGLVEVARFITPLGPPRRFDTRFFVAAAPTGRDVRADGTEIVETRWIRPADAVALWRADDFPLMSVTHRMLACLARYADTRAVIDRARERPPARRVRVNDPEGAYEVLLPGEPGYETADLEIEHGWVRL